MNSNMTAFIALTRKDILLYMENRKALVITLLAPIVMAAFFGYVMNPAGKSPSKIPIAVVDQDQSKTSQDILKAFAGDATVDVLVTDQVSAVSLIRAGKRRAAIVLPKNFGNNAARAVFTSGIKPEVIVHVDPSQSFVSGIVSGLLAQHAMKAIFSAQLTGDNSAQNLRDAANEVATSTGLNPAQKRDLSAMFESITKVQREFTPNKESARETTNEAAGSETIFGRGFTFEIPFRTKTLDVTANEQRKYNSFAHSFAGMSVQFILFMGIEFGIGLLLMQKMGLWKRLCIAPITKTTLIGSRIFASTLIAIGCTSLIYAVAIIFFGVRVDGSWVGFAGLIVTFSMLNASFGLLIAAIGRTPESARGIAIFATLVLVMLGGAWVPSFIFPEWLQAMAKFTPTYWAVEGFSVMTWRGLGIEAALPPIAGMAGFTILFTLIAVWRFRMTE